ncbi:hypothetical protein ASPSYDRAFT_52674 [Aspergillus sydowii CBS 593.65]|uniref:Uncharacterized protein n=1 Tax=Aspergillus sydowii CBS 593.65 TaxID=1036612 RepID=A0A1L9SXX1_9EURO|nr:uncharacterized protein ASPSYDRAFT_52674 [Aspergillus sydowii CBS 593.65]OJJ52020.1 hypothetical protein ASPSYDRAFT_52674 [Aspergillus sydowii CBS 593.65]
MTRQNLHPDWLRGRLEFLIGQVNPAFPAYKKALHSSCHKTWTAHHLCRCLSKKRSSKAPRTAAKHCCRKPAAPGLCILEFYLDHPNIDIG